MNDIAQDEIAGRARDHADRNQMHRAPVASTDERLALLAARYALAQESMNQRLKSQVDLGPGATDLEKHGEAVLDLMYEIAWQASELSAHTMAGLQAKALILSDWCEEREANVGDALAASLCADIKTLAVASANASAFPEQGREEEFELGAA